MAILPNIFNPKLLSPETEAEAARTDEFRRMIQADAETWDTYLEGVAQKGHGTHAPGDVASPQDTTLAAKGNGGLSASTP